ncbi:MAG: AbrB/MazE/SpoVT family DNA-binding domain-containing protein [Acidobacteriaceae bacterium]|nr:AbrB/MazE/SpoVT family DNA-binding domain-containing protein [Acidobacteriaceae bacterium]
MYTLRKKRGFATPRPATAVAKWGNAPAIRIPKQVMEKANLHEGDSIEFEVQSPGIIILRAAPVRPALEDLVAAITPRNRHGETEWGKPRGNEVW